MKWSTLREGNQPGKTEDDGCEVPAVNIRKTETDRVGARGKGCCSHLSTFAPAGWSLQGSRAATGSRETLLTGTPRHRGDASQTELRLISSALGGQTLIFHFCHILTRFKIQRRAKKPEFTLLSL